MTGTTALLCAATTAILVAGFWAEPQVWLMPVAAVTAVTAAAIDLAERRVPNAVTGSAALAAVIVIAVLTMQGSLKPSWVLAGAAVMAGPLLGSHLLTRTRTPGLGDVKLAGVLGLIVGAVHPVLAYFALTVALVLGAAGGAVYRRRTGERAFPFAPAISIAAVVVLCLASLGGIDDRWVL